MTHYESDIASLREQVANMEERLSRLESAVSAFDPGQRVWHINTGQTGSALAHRSGDGQELILWDADGSTGYADADSLYSPQPRTIIY